MLFSLCFVASRSVSHGETEQFDTHAGLTASEALRTGDSATFRAVGFENPVYKLMIAHHGDKKYSNEKQR